ncbi:hypothetical protein [Aeribacillus sp. FSL M8-0254]|uniref:hypothetical protein n=1 Tax=Aeribacillus sp. FSL M8-0254 TaxID=2954577 RepID=UPI0030FD19B5
MLTIFSIVCLTLLLFIYIYMDTKGNEQLIAGKIVLILLVIIPFIDTLIRLFTIQ